MKKVGGINVSIFPPASTGAEGDFYVKGRVIDSTFSCVTCISISLFLLPIQSPLHEYTTACLAAPKLTDLSLWMQNAKWSCVHFCLGICFRFSEVCVWKLRLLGNMVELHSLQSCQTGLPSGRGSQHPQL